MGLNLNQGGLQAVLIWHTITVVLSAVKIPVTCTAGEGYYGCLVQQLGPLLLMWYIRDKVMDKQMDA